MADETETNAPDIEEEEHHDDRQELDDLTVLTDTGSGADMGDAEVQDGGGDVAVESEEANSLLHTGSQVLGQATADPAQTTFQGSSGRAGIAASDIPAETAKDFAFDPRQFGGSDPTYFQDPPSVGNFDGPIEPVTPPPSFPGVELPPIVRPEVRLEGADPNSPAAATNAPATEPPPTDPPATDPPVTTPPATNPPVTNPPVTNPPVTNPPVTNPPVTNPPVTNPPVTNPPVTNPPVTNPPVTNPPVTNPPVTNPPVTDPPVTAPPVTDPPVTAPPVTDPPVTAPPVTDPPVTAPPVTDPPVTAPPVTDPPVTAPPVTDPPVTAPPATDPPTTEPPGSKPDGGGSKSDGGSKPDAGGSKSDSGSKPDDGGSKSDSGSKPDDGGSKSDSGSKSDGGDKPEEDKADSGSKSDGGDKPEEDKADSGSKADTGDKSDGPDSAVAFGAAEVLEDSPESGGAQDQMTEQTDSDLNGTHGDLEDSGTVDLGSSLDLSGVVEGDSVSRIVLSGLNLPEGGFLSLNGVELVADESGAVTLAGADLEAFLADQSSLEADLPLHTDMDGSVNAAVTVVDDATGLEETQTGTIDITVDAVADMPFDVSATVIDLVVPSAPDTGDQGTDESDQGDKSEGDDKSDKGDKSEDDKSDEGDKSEGDDKAHEDDKSEDGGSSKADAGHGDGDEGTSGVSAVTLGLSATFSDYTDGSESHYLLVELGDGWSNPEGYEVVDGGTITGLADASYVRIPVDGFIQSALDGDTPADGVSVTENGDGTVTVSVPVTLGTPEEGGTYNLDVRAEALDTPTDGELSSDNNRAFSGTEVSVEIEPAAGLADKGDEPETGLTDEGSKSDGGEESGHGDQGDANDVFTATSADESFDGGDGDDLFVFGDGDGHDTFDGGAFDDAWTDTIMLEDVTGGPTEGDWTLLSDTDYTVEGNSLIFEDSASGTVELDDGSTLVFEDVDQIKW